MPEKKKQKKKKDEAKFADTSEVKKVLKKLRRESEEEETSRYAKSLGAPYLDLNIFPIDQEHATFISEKDARKYHVAT